jgi:deazaflavin-dependent oxidoreductase (nitroreductase family)
VDDPGDLLIDPVALLKQLRDPSRIPDPRCLRLVETTRGGRIGGKMFGAPVLLLTTTGRRSGRSWTVPLLYQPDDDRWVIIASNGGNAKHPAWWLNLQAQPDASVQIGRQTYPVTAVDYLAAYHAGVIRGRTTSPAGPVQRRLPGRLPGSSLRLSTDQGGRIRGLGGAADGRSDPAKPIDPGKHRRTYRWIVESDRVLGGIGCATVAATTLHPRRRR